MTAIQQHRALGVCACAHDAGDVVIKVGDQPFVKLTPDQARTFTRCLVVAICRAEAIGFGRELEMSLVGAGRE